MPCPWYQHGYCTSPKLGTATDVVVSPERCLGEGYRTCAYYVDPSTVQRTPQTQQPSKDRIKAYAPIHALTRDLVIECPYCKIMTLDTGIRVAYCAVLDRLLTRFEAELCEKYWKNCPYRAYAASLT